MSGETEREVSGWTTDTLHSHLVRLLEERGKEFDARFQAQEQAIALAREAEIRDQKGHTEVLETRLNAMDKATDLLAATVNRVPTDVDKQVAHLKSLHDERFASVDEQIGGLDISMGLRFQERDTRSEREARDNKIAVDAAFAAAKEAVAENNKSSALANDKSEATFTKQIDGIQLLIATTNKATDEKVSDLKDQLARLMAGGIARREVGSDNRQNIQWVVGLVVIIAAALVSYLAAHFH